MRDYTFNGTRVYFNTPVFRKLVQETYGDKIQNACERIAEGLHERDRDFPAERWHTVYYWLNRRTDTGSYTSPNSIDTVEMLAAILSTEERPVKPEDLLTPSPYTEFRDIIDAPLEAFTAQPPIYSPIDMLLKAVFSYKASRAYNFIPNVDDADGLPFWTEFIAHAADRISLTTSDSAVMERRLNLCDDLSAFIHAFEYADGLPETLFQANPNLRFFTSPYMLMESSMESFVKAGSVVKYHSIPNMQDILDYKQFFSCRQAELPRCDEEELFMYELAAAVKKLYYAK